MNFRSISPIACLSLFYGLTFCGCDAKVVPRGSTDLNEVKKFNPYRVYYSGDKVDELPFTGISDAKAGRWIYWGFGYGDCDLPSGFFAEGGCSLPLSIQNWSICYRWPRQPRRNRPLFDLRGAKATGGARNGSSLEVFTGRTTVVVFAHDQRVAMSAARQLRTVNQAQPEPLPPPAPGSLQGKLPCQHKRVDRAQR